ncbi:MAG: SusD/RagB family nutrient-binding outer membrane lipoprotein [Prevotella sp.]|nr:SusD/RagB family nutrient-binding outer membrane lipoprotein [Candidatus Prevotella equi]
MISKYKSIALGLAMAATCAFTSCSDDFMSEINTDDSKAEIINPNSLLTTALLQTYGDFGLMDTYRSYITGFTQQYAGGWNVTNYAGSVFYSDAEAAKLWDKYYSVGLKNLQDGIEKSADKKNINAILRIHRVYMYSILTDVYGDIPCFEACTGFATPKYDKQEDIYDWFFKELGECVDQLGTGNDLITGDVTSLNGKTESWKRFANSLRLRYAMRISDAKPEVAKTEFLKALAADGGVIENVDQSAYVNYLDVPYTLYKGAEKLDFRANALGEVLYGQDRESPSFVCATFVEMMKNTNDPRMWRICRYYYNYDRSETRPDAENIDVTEDVKSYFGDNISKYWPEIGTAWYDNANEDWAKYDVADFPSLSKKAINPGFDMNAGNSQVRMKVPMVNIDFERPQTPGILITSAEVKFLIAEAISKNWITDKDINEVFKNGIWEAMQIYNKLYFSSADAYASKISDTEITDYINSLNVDLTNNAREEINKQAYILHFTNPSECWANIRRSDYPVLKDRSKLPTWPKFPHDENLTTPLRLCYPQLETDYNSANYNEAISRLGGTDDWHKPVWWDVNAQNFK